MPRKRKLNDMSNRCRICLASDACTSQLFVDWLQPKIQNLEKCSSIEILDKPNYPKKVCYICLYKLDMWNEFKSQFMKTNQTLMNHFKFVDTQTTEADKIIDVESAIDDIFSGIDGKRPRVVVEELKSVGFSMDNDEPMKSPLSPTKTSILKNVDSNVEAVIINETEKKVITVNKSHTSDSSSSPVRKISRAKKVEREALTKRWEERKNALLAATGEIPSESDSDNGTQLSPVQKARAKFNSSSEKDEQKSKKIQRALKNLETNMTEKYTVSLENAIAEDERKTRSRRGNAENQVKEAIPTKTSKTLKIELPKTDIQKEMTTPEKISESNADLSLKVKSKEIAKEEEPIENIAIVTKKPPEASVVNQPEQFREENEIEIIDVDDTSSVTPVLPLREPAFTPQLVTSEIQLGNATYVVRTTLGLPNTLSSKNDISLKTNGINIDAINQESGKIDLLNSIRLQDIGTESNSDSKENGNIEKCLNIEIEGVEVEALQRVQLELAKFINEDIQKRLLEESTAQNETDPNSLNFKDSYESLEYQLKNIVEKVLRKNYEMEKKDTMAPHKSSKTISPEFAKEAEKSPVFQPKVAITKFNLGKLCKIYHINNLHILEEVKRQSGVVGPLSKTLGKRNQRTLKLPKRYDDFDITLPAGSEAVRTATPTPKPPMTKRADSPITVVPEVVQNDIIDESIIGDTSEPVIEPIREEPVTQIEIIENNVPTSSSIENESLVQEVKVDEKKKEAEKKTVVKKPIEKKPVKETIMPASKAITSLQPVLTMIKNAQPHVETILLVPTSPPVNAQVKPIDPKMKPLPSLASRSSLGNVNNKSSLKQMLPTPLPVKSTPKPLTPNSTPSKAIVKRQRHICGICGKELFSKEEAEAHVKSHKTDSLALSSKPLKQILPKASSGLKPTIVTTTTVTSPAVESQSQSKTKPKPKLMRCKRCQAIVEAKEVRSHVCNSVKFNCTLCECSFGAEHLLLEHIETHARNNKIVKKTDVKPTQKSLPNSKTTQERVIVIAESNESASNEQEENLGENQHSYSCFVCDKIFLEEDQMKEHLQMHCEEVANDSDADGHQCAFCGEKFQSEEILEAHVGNHLKDDGDEKINMIINMETRRVLKPKKSTSPVFRCEQCTETFSSSLQLAMHLPVHEDESMVIEEEPEEDEHYVCNVCDEIFDSPDELAEHLNTEHNGNTHMCILCETSFSSVRELQEHVSTHL
ncbi:titin-like isoform X2 [Phymastichus coffea]|uniref:titin-like isoform X2 n=1 Tax=Phymastichus coffea TaxID=108790 RepID=UPI00273BF1BD|nr:titin-like isoform X2 [Phymastichus coffea]